MKEIALKAGFHNVSQTEEGIYCREEKSYGGELVRRYMILVHFNFNSSNTAATMLAKK